MSNTTTNPAGQVVSQARVASNSDGTQNAIEITAYNGDLPVSRIVVAATKVLAIPSLDDLGKAGVTDGLQELVTRGVKSMGRIGAAIVEGAEPLALAQTAFEIANLVTKDGTQAFDINYSYGSDGNMSRLQFTTYPKDAGPLPNSSDGVGALDKLSYTTTTLYADQQKDPVTHEVLQNPPQLLATTQSFGPGSDGKSQVKSFNVYYTDGSKSLWTYNNDGSMNVREVDKYGNTTKSTLYKDGKVIDLPLPPSGGLISYVDTNFDGTNGDANRANFMSFLQADETAMMDFVTGFSADSLTSDFKIAGDMLALTAFGHPLSPDEAQRIFGNAEWLEQIDQLANALKEHGLSGAFATAQVGASIIAHSLGYKYAPNTDPSAQPALAARWANAAAALGDLATLARGGPGTLSKDARDLAAGVDLLRIASAGDKAAALALGRVAGIIGDIAGIIQGFEQGGIEGGLTSGFSAAMLGILLKWSAGSALTVGIVVGLAAAFLGGSHDNPHNMPDKYDPKRYGQGVADLQGQAGASQVTYHEDPGWVQLFGGRTGIQAVEETLYNIKVSGVVPEWIKPIYQDLMNKFGYSQTGSGNLWVGDEQHKSVNNQQIRDVPGTSGATYQYLELDTSLYGFGASFAAAMVDGQAMPFSQLAAAAGSGSGSGTASGSGTGYNATIDSGSPAHDFYA
jgi:hypothetical protein